MAACSSKFHPKAEACLIQPWSIAWHDPERLETKMPLALHPPEFHSGVEHTISISRTWLKRESVLLSHVARLRNEDRHLSVDQNATDHAEPSSGCATALKEHSSTAYTCARVGMVLPMAVQQTCRVFLLLVYLAATVFLVLLASPVGHPRLRD